MLQQLFFFLLLIYLHLSSSSSFLFFLLSSFSDFVRRHHPVHFFFLVKYFPTASSDAIVSYASQFVWPFKRRRRRRKVCSETDRSTSTGQRRRVIRSRLLLLDEPALLFCYLVLSPTTHIVICLVFLLFCVCLLSVWFLFLFFRLGRSDDQHFSPFSPAHLFKL